MFPDDVPSTIIEEYTEEVEFNVTAPLLEKLPEMVSDPVASISKTPSVFTVRPERGDC